MNNSTKEIPRWTWHNGQFLFQFDEQLKKDPNLSISDFFSQYLESQGLQKSNVYHTKNQGIIIMLLYGLLLIPKEIWEKDKTDFKFETREKFTITISKIIELKTLDFLRHIRNSLAHANFYIDTENGNFVFWNIHKKEKNFEVQITYENIGEFISEIGKYYINGAGNRH